MVICNFDVTQRPEEVEEAMNHSSRFDTTDPEALQTTQEAVRLLSEYIDIQLEHGLCDLEANLALLEQFLINASLANEEDIHRILLLALCEIPQTTFQLCMYQIHEKQHKTDKVKALVSLSQLLEMCRFPEFWKQTQVQSAMLGQYPGWEEKFRSHICNVVNATFTNLEQDKLSEIINAEAGTPLFDELCTQFGWKVSGTKVTIKDNKASADNETNANDLKSHGISLEQLNQCLTAASR